MDDASLDGPASLERALDIAAWAEDDEQLQDTLMRSSPIQPVVEEDEDEEDEGTPSPADFRKFQGNGTEEELSSELRSGMEFDNADSAKVAIIAHSLAQSGASAKGESNAERIRYECGSKVDNGGASAACGYHVTITYRKNVNKWVVANKKRSKQNLVHTCTPLAGERLSHSCQIFVEAMLRQHCTVTRTSPAKDLQKILKDKLNCEVPLQAIYSAKLAITDGDVDRQAAAFRQLSAWVERFVALQEGNVAECDTRMGASFFAPRLSQLAWPHLRPLVSVDGAHSKSCHDYVLFLAVASDANKQSVTLAWGHAKTEKRESWEWFLSRLSDCYPGLDSKGTVIMSDRGKGLVPAISNVLPLAIPSHCAVHLIRNVRNRKHIGSTKEAVNIFKKMIWAETPEEFQRHRAELSGPARNYVDTFDTAQYACHAFPTTRFGLVSSNTVEQLNGWLLVARGGDIISLFSTIYDHLRASFRDRHNLLVVKPRLVERDIIQDVYRKVRGEKSKAKDYRALVTAHAGRGGADEEEDGADEEEDDEHMFLFSHVHRNGMDGIAKQRIVRLELPVGTGEFRQWALPCRHVWAVLLNDYVLKRFEKRLNPLRYIPHCHSSLAFRKTYSFQFDPLPTDNFEETQFNLPDKIAGLGRRSKKRGQSGVAPTQNSQLRVEGGMSQPGVVKKRGRPKTSKKRKQPDGTLAPLGKDELLPAGKRCYQCGLCEGGARHKARSKKCKYFGRAVGEELEVPRDVTNWRDWE
ncbi:hypothetical protein L198_05013 [Cryptococcus wingfieldii CBS 7118]|uniref:MULE transposase domain-containing protein n=1 Tax=Cryptococcus wingfieldii CBS 7118 TaxID=1295528 RepID=A0A1E3J022_9TREE|nr:hypothetical protein L198_05013 [Cryptococcus wingfieldii CBS 7118]ODN94162.1 hypothetical protein L198_05013 [Cryptococcus wingfieldii CBS 7118]